MSQPVPLQLSSSLNRNHPTTDRYKGCKNSVSGESFIFVENMNLSRRYRDLLDLFDQVLGLSYMILSELEKKGKQENLEGLIGKKDAAGRSIARLTQEIASVEIGSNSELSLKTLSEIKPILKQIEQKASLLQAVEGRIQDLVKRNQKS